MFSEQHHEAIADAIRKARERVQENSNMPWHAGELSNAIMREFAGLLEADNPAFDRARFNSRVFIGRLDHEPDCEDEHVEPLPTL